MGGEYQNVGYLNEAGCGCRLVPVAQDKDQWRAVVNTAINLRVP
jgi:hypothetical protein